MERSARGKSSPLPREAPPGGQTADGPGPRRADRILPLERPRRRHAAQARSRVRAGRDREPKVPETGFQRVKLERAMGFEPTTPTLARLCSTPELRPHPVSSGRHRVPPQWHPPDRPGQCRRNEAVYAPPRRRCPAPKSQSSTGLFACNQRARRDGPARAEASAEPARLRYVRGRRATNRRVKKGELKRSADWSGRWDSNPRPQPWQGCALPLSYARILSR